MQVSPSILLKEMSKLCNYSRKKEKGKEKMREYNEFKNFVEKHLAVFLPETYREARIEIFPVHKTNGLDYDGLTIRLGENGAAPLLPMKPYYQQPRQHS